MQLKQINKKFRRNIGHLRFSEIGYVNSFVYELFEKAQEAYFELTGKYIPFTDLYRSPDKSRLARIKKGKKAAKPANSGHNFGVSIDIDLKQVFKDLQLEGGYDKKLTHVREFFKKLGFHYIIRKDGICEDWHFNLFNTRYRKDVIKNKAGESRDVLSYFCRKDNLFAKWSIELEQTLINAINPILFKNTIMVVTDSLKVDGVKGRKTKAAIDKIMNHFKLTVYNDEHVKRMLICLYLEHNKESKNDD